MSIRLRTNGEPVPIRAPVHGKVVWSDVFRRAMPPFEGPEAGVNDEFVYAIQLQDAWGFVHQLLGFDEQAIWTNVGRTVQPGDILGYAPVDPVNAIPPSRQPPSDPPKRYKEEGFEPFPFRFRKLEIRVALPPTTWQGAIYDPNAEGWTYIHPQLVYHPGRHRPSHMAPLCDPHSMKYANGNKNTPTSLVMYPMNLGPPLPELVELFVSLPTFMESPGDVDDAMDPLTLYALEWAVIRDDDTVQSLCTNASVYWRRSFEHSKLQRRTGRLDDPDFLFAHYVPHVRLGGLMGHSVSVERHSQFDEKARQIVYAVTRTRFGVPTMQGLWNTTQEGQSGLFRLAVRARGVTGDATCLEDVVYLETMSTWRGALVQSTVRYLLHPPMLTPLPFSLAPIIDHLVRWMGILLDQLQHLIPHILVQLYK